MNWKRLLVKVGKWLVRQGANELLKEAQKRKEKADAVRPV